jgi:hypothetical protein
VSTTYGSTTISARPERGKSRSDFDVLVESWNGLRPSERQARATTCSRHGHQWADVVDGGVRLYVVCRRCCAYDMDKAL